MYKLDKVKKFLLLVGSFVVFTLIYYLAVYLKFRYITPVYLLLITICSVLYFLVNGGITPIMQKEKEKEKALDIKYGNSKRAQKREQYKKHIVETVEIDEHNQSTVIRPNPLKLPPYKQKFFSDILLIITAPLILVILVDYFLLMFGII